MQQPLKTLPTWESSQTANVQQLAFTNIRNSIATALVSLHLDIQIFQGSSGRQGSRWMD
jgi:hypothetical protein